MEIPFILDVTFKENTNELGDIKQEQGKHTRALPKHAIRYSCATLEISYKVGDEKHYVHQAEALNSSKICRTLMNAIAYEIPYDFRYYTMIYGEMFSQNTIVMELSATMIQTTSLTLQSMHSIQHLYHYESLR